MADFLCQERYGTVISNGGNPTERIARFLKPCAASSADAERISCRAHLLFEEMSSRDKGWPKKVNFRGWAAPQRNWDIWVEKLKAKRSVMWEHTGIYDAIMGSCCEIRCNKEIVLGLAEFWCTETNTFVFPWGEATITLEDVMILGGFSVLGEPIEKPVTMDALEMAVNAMRERKAAMSREKSKKASHGAWMKHFMENDSEFEHVAFLSLWLSRYVFPIPVKETMSKDVFSIAAHLSEGTQMALAPAVLAGLYKNLRLLKDKVLSFDDEDDEITVFAPFQLVLLWAFEHFPRLVQKPPNKLEPWEPRAARWHKVTCKMEKSVVNNIFITGECFQWRPYAAEISNSNHLSYYRDEKHLLVDNGKNSDENLQCYVICMKMSYLAGFDCKERYMPHRVAMQFGMDQDLPGEFSALHFVPENVSFFVPPRSFEPSVSLRYFEWWKNSEFICRGKQPNILRKSSDTFQTSPDEVELSSKDYHTPSVAMGLKNGETVTQSSMKYEALEIVDDKLSDDFDVLFKPVGKSGSLERRSPTIEDVNGEGGCCTSPKSFALGSPECSTPCSVGIRSHAFVTSQFSPTQRFQDFEADHVAVAGTSKQMAKDPTEIDDGPPSEPDSQHRANGSSRKRKLCTSTEGTSDCKATISMINGNTYEFQREQVEEAVNVKEGNFKLRQRDFEKRIEKLEKLAKLLGISPDIV